DHSMAAEAEVGTETPGRKGPSRLLLIIGAAAAILLVAGAGLFLFLSSAGDADSGSAQAVRRDTLIIALPTMMVNLNSDGDGQAYMKLTIALKVADEKMMTEIQPRLPKVIDAFQVYMRELRKSDLEGSAGIYRLKEELLRRVNLSIYPAQVE